MINPIPTHFSFVKEVKKCKKPLLKERFQTLIKAKGMSEADFYNSLGLSRQYWYFISWGVWDCSIELKVKIAQALSIDSSVIWQESKKESNNVQQSKTPLEEVKDLVCPSNPQLKICQEKDRIV